MDIQIHPDAARRFNELANEVLTKIQPEPELMPVKGQFRPDIYPVAKIPQEDIIENIRAVNSIVDGTGEEVGRLFEHESHRVGLIGEDFKAFMRIVESVHNSEPLRNTTSVEFIRDSVFEWIEARHKNMHSQPLTDYVVKRAMEEIKDFEIWIPIHRTHLERPLMIGDVSLRTITGEMLERWHSRAEDKIKQSEDAAAIRFALARDRSQLQSYAAAVINIRAEKRHAVSVAREKAESAVALLRFVSLANWTPKLRSYCALLDSENVRRRTELFVKDESITSHNRGVLDDGGAWAITDAYLKDFQRLLVQISKLAGAKSKTPFQQRLYDALLIYSRNSVAIEPTDKLVYILVALESILLRNSTEPLSKNIGERMAFLIADSVERRKAVVANVDATYRLRSSFIHHGQLIANLETLSTFMLNAWTCFHNLFFVTDRFQTTDDLISALEDRKMT